MSDYKTFCLDLVNRALNSNREIPRSFHRNASGTWLGNAVFQIAAINDVEEPILYIGATMALPQPGDDVQRHEGDGYLGGTVCAFSESTFYVSLDRQGDLNTVAYPLALRSLQVTQVQGNYDIGDGQPYRVDIDMELLNGLAFQLPLHPNATQAAYDELQAALPILRAALSPINYPETATNSPEL